MDRALLLRAAARTALAGAMLCASLPTQAREAPPVSVRNSFRIGDAGVICTAQNSPGDARLEGIFERGYRLTCRDAASAVGTALVLRRAIDITLLPSGLTEAAQACEPIPNVAIDGLGPVTALDCRASGDAVSYRRYAATDGGTTYLVEGYAGYDPALRLALATLVTDRPVSGTVQVAQTEVSDAAAFARVQAGSLDALDARDEAYSRNNSGRYAEAQQFFEAITARNGDGAGNFAEAAANQALQQSNLGNFAAAGRLLAAAAAATPRSDGVTQRLVRNYRAIDALNRGEPRAAIDALGAPVTAVEEGFDIERLRRGEINAPLSEQINRENLALQRLGGIDSGLTASERAELLDAQAAGLAGMAARRQGELERADALFSEADRRIQAVRQGRVLSARSLRAELAMERALVIEQLGDPQRAVSAFDLAIANLEQSVPQSPTLLAARARKAALLQRSGDEAAARQLFGEVVAASATVSDAGAVLRDLLRPYFAMLTADGSPEASADLFRASQILQRPGVAQTQAILAREMSEDNDEASALFRLSLNRTREIARTEAEIAQLSALAEPSARELEALGAAQSSLANLQQQQVALLAQLAQFPRYKALAPQGLDLAELQQGLREGEAYYKMMVLGDAVYGMWIDRNSSRSFPIPIGLGALSDEVALIRDSIVVEENGQQVTYPFDARRARNLYKVLFDPVGDAMAGVRHLVFEPDGPVLQLPPQLLIAEDAGLDSYEARIAEPDGDPYDMRGIAWLARDRDVSIAVSPRGFLDIRAIAPSRAQRAYLGLGSNAVPMDRPVAAVADECEWPLANWQNPISSDELYFASAELGEGASDVITGAGFTDTALLASDDLDQYRVLHFATHGLVTAPRPSCPARPALLTSFGGEGSDGLLSFREVFDLKLDADLVILSACDTAGMATIGASREAGITTGGNYALDGLVRAFVGAGARSVVASHWPVPDDYDATKRLIAGMIDGGQGATLGHSLGDAQRALMADAATSHPFYWAAFIILGDGEKQVVGK